jgi:hypothetical protein
MKSDDSGMRIGGNRVFDAGVGDVLMQGTEGQIVDTVLKKNFHFMVLFFVVSPQHLQVFRQLTHTNPQFIALLYNESIFFESVFEFHLHMPHFY